MGPQDRDADSRALLGPHWRRSGSSAGKCSKQKDHSFILARLAFGQLSLWFISNALFAGIERPFECYLVLKLKLDRPKRGPP